MSEQQFRRWQGYSLLRPWGFLAEERRFALLASLLTKGRSAPGRFWYQPDLEAAKPPRRSSWRAAREAMVAYLSRGGRKRKGR
jgi:hypothetical protein